MTISFRRIQFSSYHIGDITRIYIHMIYILLLLSLKVEALRTAEYITDKFYLAFPKKLKPVSHEEEFDLSRILWVQ